MNSRYRSDGRKLTRIRIRTTVGLLPSVRHAVGVRPSSCKGSCSRVSVSATDVTGIMLLGTAKYTQDRGPARGNPPPKKYKEGRQKTIRAYACARGGGGRRRKKSWQKKQKSNKKKKQKATEAKQTHHLCTPSQRSCTKYCSRVAALCPYSSV